MGISILIPTRNRAAFLARNCELVARSIRDYRLTQEAELIISNNASVDGTASMLDDFADSADFAVRVVHQKENIGSVANCLFLLDQAKSEYVLFLGDDDFLAPAYLARVCRELQERAPACIIPSIRAVDLSGSPTGFGRDLGKAEAEYAPGFRNCLRNAWRGHQCSGLVFRRDGLARTCAERGVENLYLFVFLVAYACLHGRTLHLTSEPVSVTSAPQAAKEFTYGSNGLLNAIFDNFVRLQELRGWQRFLLEQRMLDRQYWRYAMYLKLGPRAFLRCLRDVAREPNATAATRLSIFAMAPFYMAKNAVALILTGQMGRVLARRVEV